MSETFVYPVAIRALQKWEKNNLDVVGQVNGTAHYRFSFNGSTCNNGGTPFKAFLHTELDVTKTEPTVRRAWIEIPEDQMESAGEMCSYRSGAEKFLESLADFPKMSGKSIADILSEEVDLNHAGCFCTVPMVNQKWRMALSTIHYAMNNDEDEE